jgi:hypothetical protein
VVQVIVQVPTDTYVINPVSLTVAIVSSELDQVTVLNVALSGVTVAVNCSVQDGIKDILFLFKVTQVTGILQATSQVPVNHQSISLAVIVQYQTDTNVTNQVLSTVAIDSSELYQLASL